MWVLALAFLATSCSHFERPIFYHSANTSVTTTPNVSAEHPLLIFCNQAWIKRRLESAVTEKALQIQVVGKASDINHFIPESQTPRAIYIAETGVFRQDEFLGGYADLLLLPHFLPLNRLNVDIGIHVYEVSGEQSLSIIKSYHKQQSVFYSAFREFAIRWATLNELRQSLFDEIWGEHVVF